MGDFNLAMSREEPVKDWLELLDSSDFFRPTPLPS
jgi:hypothetical protein